VDDGIFDDGAASEQQLLDIRVRSQKNSALNLLQHNSFILTFSCFIRLGYFFISREQSGKIWQCKNRIPPKFRKGKRNFLGEEEKNHYY